MIEIISVESPAKRRRYPPEFKAKILKACQEPSASVVSVAQQYAIHVNLIHKWRRQAKGNQKPVDKRVVSVPLPVPMDRQR